MFADNYHSRTLHSSRPNPAIEQNGTLPEIDIDPNEPKYCYCNQVSFGDMVACDGDNVSSSLNGCLCSINSWIS